MTERLVLNNTGKLQYLEHLWGQLNLFLERQFEQLRDNYSNRSRDINENSVNSEIFGRNLFSRKALKDIFAAFKLRG